MPVVALCSYATMLVLPLLGVIKFMKVAENSTDYSVNNTARHVLWLPTTAEMKYKGKPTIDSLFARVGDGLAAATALVGVHVLTASTRTYFAVNVSLVVVWLALAAVVIREHNRISSA
jgi:AAA family ATP:ADP antiporter